MARSWNQFCLVLTLSKLLSFEWVKFGSSLFQEDYEQRIFLYPTSIIPPNFQQMARSICWKLIFTIGTFPAIIISSRWSFLALCQLPIYFYKETFQYRGNLFLLCPLISYSVSFHYLQHFFGSLSFSLYSECWNLLVYLPLLKSYS